MKVRRGFVSNSSSSSFIVAFPRNPTSWQELQEWLFGQEQTHIMWDDDAVPTADLAQIIWWNIQLASPMDGEWVQQELASAGGEYGQENPERRAERKALYKEECQDITPERKQEIADRLYDLDQEAAAQVYQATMAATMAGGAVAYRFSYGDHTKLGGHLDHGDVFKNLPHVRINEH
jgi:hypothetical protein